MACYDAAYELDNENVLILNNKAAVYFAQKDYDKCIEVRVPVVCTTRLRGGAE